MTITSLISADSHVVEPPDLWEERIDRRFKDAAPRLVEHEGTHRWVVGDDVNLGSLGAPSQAGRRYSGLTGLGLAARMEEVPEAAYDPDARLEAMAEDGVEAEVVYSTIGTRIYTSPVGGELMSACFSSNERLVGGVRGRLLSEARWYRPHQCRRFGGCHYRARKVSAARLARRGHTYPPGRRCSLPPAIL